MAFDPTKHALQCYGTGWQSASFLDQERQLFGAPGGIMHDWDLKTNIDGIYAAGDQLFASDCCGFACATGYYAGRKAADYADTVSTVRNADDPEACESRAESVCMLRCLSDRGRGYQLEGTEHGDFQGHAELLRRRKVRSAAGGGAGSV